MRDRSIDAADVGVLERLARERGAPCDVRFDKVTDGIFDVVSEGHWKLFTP